MSQLWMDHVSALVRDQEARGLGRRMAVIDRTQGPTARVDGRPMLLFCGNDYLGYSHHPALKQAAREAVEQWGVGAGASRLISGNLGLYQDLETAAARFKHVPAAVVFPTGFMANQGLVTSLAGPEDLILSDELNHASLVDACRLSRARVRVVPHNRVEGYEAALKESGGRRTLMVTDGVFSMDGDVAPLPDLHRLAREYDALLVVDDAHGTGVLGENGRGGLEHFRLQPDDAVVQMATFSKALGGLGGFVAGPDPVVDLLKNRARPLFYTTGLPPATLAANARALALVDEEPETRARLLANAAQLRILLEGAGLQTIPGPSAIVPILVGEAGPALKVSQRLKDAGLFCPAIRPPTVPDGQCRLRLTVMATHTADQIDRAARSVADAFQKEGLI